MHAQGRLGRLGLAGGLGDQGLRFGQQGVLVLVRADELAADIQQHRAPPAG